MGVKIGDLPNTSNIQPTDLVELEQGLSGTSRNASLTQIRDWVLSLPAVFLSSVSAVSATISTTITALDATIQATLTALNVTVTGAFQAGAATITGALTGSSADFSAGVEAQNFLVTPTSLTQDSPTTVDLNGPGVRTLSLSGDITFATSNRAAGRSVTVKILADGSTRNFTFPAWVFVGTEPTDIAANKTAVLSLTAFGADETDVVAAYAVEA